jgi:hypothetical protein
MWDWKESRVNCFVLTWRCFFTSSCVSPPPSSPPWFALGSEQHSKVVWIESYSQNERGLGIEMSLVSIACCSLEDGFSLHRLSGRPPSSPLWFALGWQLQSRVRKQSHKHSSLITSDHCYNNSMNSTHLVGSPELVQGSDELAVQLWRPTRSRFPHSCCSAAVMPVVVDAGGLLHGQTTAPRMPPSPPLSRIPQPGPGDGSHQRCRQQQQPEHSWSPAAAARIDLSSLLRSKSSKL